MGIEQVRAFFAAQAPDIVVLETDLRTATVAEAAAAHAVAPAQIAKTLSLRIGPEVVLLVASGDVRLDNRKAKAVFGTKPRFLEGAEVVALTGHPVGGVCPFGLLHPLRVYCDLSLLRFAEVVPAAGSTQSALRIAPRRMAALTNADWVDCCALPEA